MNIDFALILTILLLVTAPIWALDRFYLQGRREAAAAAGGEVGKPSPVVEFARFLFPVVAIVFVLRGFLVEPFRIPSGSMLPTLEVGDFILVNKFSYGLRLPVANWKFLDLGSPQRGDIVVFRYPRDPSTPYIKRVVGLPGDEITYYNKVLYVNGKPMLQEYVGRYPDNHARSLDLLVEQLGPVRHYILRDPNRPAFNNSWRVPAGAYFVMGDNRDNSNDSRVWGVVPDENLVGRAFFIWMHWNGGPDLGRLGPIGGLD